ncbi:MAG TPA: ferredoxin--NADP reductase [Candidatus Limnocylindrales bacterium]|nr:ferredoxin--NADP reductase [Candidatus Limnocylindrales bacterium]
MIATDKYMSAPIVARTDYAPTLWSIRIKTPEPLPFRAGQYVAFGLLNGEKVLERAFSIASSPYEDELEFFIERVPDGALSPQLYDLQVGDAVQMRRKAKGIFNLDLKSGHRQHFLVSTVTGIAPYISYVRTMLRDQDAGRLDEPHRLVVLQGTSRSDEFGYDKELLGYAERAPWLTYIPTISRPWEDPAWPGERGRVDDLIRKYADTLGLDPATTTAYLCGNPGMIANARDILRRRGFEHAAIKEETYWAPGEGEVEY